ncbi:RWD domain-containing protein 1-like isoform X1 [Branchiostoma floridae]|uniref:RWD domain-containing protein 1 n=1 Tax=Branchiostoma floridae TaxID=7739 RepID=A0A9J7LPA1_BRAFL|nr:RWD domain-containing protein 1-like isoform X1 [Branchiostoma floridae]
MTDYEEDQRNEIEALESIYPDIFEILETEPPCFRLSVLAEADSYEECDPLGVDLQFTYVPTYPDAPPDMEVLSPQNLTEEDVSTIQELLQQQAEENLGMVMVFTLVSAVQERLSELVEEKKKQAEEERERKQREEEEKEKKRFEGTRVNIETFLAWKARFDQEMAEKKKSKKDEDNSKKLSGKQLFERDTSLNDSDARFLDNEDITLGAGDESVEVDESLFQDMADLDLDEDLDLED